jgi:hypothetical protein
MKLAIPAVVLIAACQTQPAEAPQSVAEAPHAVSAFKATGDLDLAAGPMTVADFLSACQTAAGVNFTYSKPTSTAMLSTELQFDTATHVPASNVPEFITSTLDAHGFAIKPIGPEHLRVLLVEPKRG